jgi:hypothetical protein
VIGPIARLDGGDSHPALDPFKLESVTAAVADDLYGINHRYP